MKQCTKCKIHKEFVFFYKQKISKDGHHNICICCRKEYNLKVKEITSQHYLDNKEKYKNNSKKYYLNNKEKICVKSTEWGKKNPIKVKQHQKKWNKNNLEYFRKWRKKQWDFNPNFRLRVILGNRLNELLKKSKTYKENNIIELINCSIEELKLYLEQQFKPEMTWENHGEIWEVDHIKACANFDLTDPMQQKQCFHYINLQPLFKTTEIAKSFGYIDQIGNRNKSSN
jgi:hypothetical protein